VDKPFPFAKRWRFREIKTCKWAAMARCSDKGPQTELLDLQGKLVLPGLIDSHTHPTARRCSNRSSGFGHGDNPGRPRVHQGPARVWRKASGLVQQVVYYAAERATLPTRADWIAAAPKHPVAFRTGPDASVNTLALKLNGIDRSYKPHGVPGKIEKDARGEPLHLRNAGNY